MTRFRFRLIGSRRDMTFHVDRLRDGKAIAGTLGGSWWITRQWHDTARGRWRRDGGRSTWRFDA